MPKIIKIDPLQPSAGPIAEAGRIISRGGVIAFPTKRLYGLGADAFNREAVDKVFKIKKRPSHKPLLVLIDNKTVLAALVNKVPASAERIMECFWPGHVTIVFECQKSLPTNLTAGTKKIGVRLPAHPVAVSLARSVAGPLTATSANIAGGGGCSRITEMDPSMSAKLDLVLDAGVLQGGVGSTVVDVTFDPPKILREGAVPSAKLFSVLKI